jgi:hypothetical protein
MSKMRPMTEAPTAAGEDEILMRIECADGSSAWACVAPTGDLGRWAICMTGATVEREADDWLIVGPYGDTKQVVEVPGWIPSPRVLR